MVFVQNRSAVIILPAQENHCSGSVPQRAPSDTPLPLAQVLVGVVRVLFEKPPDPVPRSGSRFKDVVILGRAEFACLEVHCNFVGGANGEADRGKGGISRIWRRDKAISADVEVIDVPDLRIEICYRLINLRPVNMERCLASNR